MWICASTPHMSSLRSANWLSTGTILPFSEQTDETVDLYLRRIRFETWPDCLLF
jgi:hypothetical protein